MGDLSSPGRGKGRRAAIVIAGALLAVFLLFHNVDGGERYSDYRHCVASVSARARHPQKKAAEENCLVLWQLSQRQRLNGR